MKAQIIKKGDFYTFRYKFLFFWWYPGYDFGGMYGDWLWPDETSWMSYNKAKEFYDEHINSYTKSKKFTNSKINIIESKEL